MVEEKSSDYANALERIKQTISVPFVWEDRPGTPKREWKHSTLPVYRIALPTPIKLIASVPFQWEEEPGKPFPPMNETSPESSPPRCSEQNYSSSESYYDGEGEHDGTEADEFSGSAPSLLANRLVPTTAISNAVPVEETSMVLDSNSWYLQAPSSPAWETESTTSSYATGATSLVGDSFLQCMFPLLAPKSGFLEKVGFPEGEFYHSPGKASRKDFDPESVSSAVGRKAITLGELIMMSRRRSYQRKAVQMGNHSLSMEFMEGNAIGCCIRIGGLQKLKRQLQLKQI